MNSEKLKKVEADIAKTKAKVSEFTARLRELERQKTEIENAGIVALVRDMAVHPDELTAFIQAFKEQSRGGAVLPVLATEPAGGELHQPENNTENKEDANEEE